MRFSGTGIKTAAAATALSLVLAACGGSEPAPSVDETPTLSDVESATEEVVEAATEATEEATDTVETAAADAEAVAEDVAEDATEAVEDGVETAEGAVEETVEAAEEVVEDVTEMAAEAVDSATSDRVSAEVVAQYAGLTGDAQNGRRVFTQCMSCHAVQEGRNMAGPSLYGIVGREAGTIPGFRYSDANANSGIVWTEEVMFAYLERPQSFIPGTIMAFPGLRNPQDRADVIAYLLEQSS